MNNFRKGKYVMEKYNVCYGSAIPTSFVSNDSLVIKIYYSRNKIKFEKDKFIENQKNKNKFMDELVGRLKDEVKEKLEINCEVIVEKYLIKIKKRNF